MYLFHILQQRVEFPNELGNQYVPRSRLFNAVVGSLTHLTLRASQFFLAKFSGEYLIGKLYAMDTHYILSIPCLFIVPCYNSLESILNFEFLNARHYFHRQFLNFKFGNARAETGLSIDVISPWEDAKYS